MDDDAFMRRLLPPHLSEVFGVHASAIEVARSPQEALRLLSQPDTRPLVVLSDYDLKAEMTGIDLLRAVRALRPDALCVLMSGHARDEVAPGSALPHEFLEKPLHVAELVHALHRIVTAERAQT